MDHLGINDFGGYASERQAMEQHRPCGSDTPVRPKGVNLQSFYVHLSQTP